MQLYFGDCIDCKHAFGVSDPCAELSGQTGVTSQEASVDKKIEREIKEIENTQGKLRESIEQTKDLAEQADKLFKKHKKTLKDQAED